MNTHGKLVILFADDLKFCKVCNIMKTKADFIKIRHSNGRWYWYYCCRTCQGKKNKECKLRYPERTRASGRRCHLKRKFGITVEDYDRMLSAQGGVCMICRKPSQNNLHVDHCHKTGIVRSLLCGHCNRMIGLAGDDPMVLISAAEYLRGGVK